MSKGAINAWLEVLAAVRLGTPRSWGLTPGPNLGAGSRKTLLPAFLSSMSDRHRRVVRSVSTQSGKARLGRVAILRLVPLVVRDQQIQTHSQGEVQTGQELFHLGEGCSIWLQWW